MMGKIFAIAATLACGTLSLALVSADAQASTQKDGVTITFAGVRDGKLVVEGKTKKPKVLVTLIGLPFKNISKTAGIFRLTSKVIPADCKTWLKTPEGSMPIYLANCGPKGDPGPQGLPGPMGPAGKSGPDAAATVSATGSFERNTPLFTGVNKAAAGEYVLTASTDLTSCYLTATLTGGFGEIAVRALSPSQIGVFTADSAGTASDRTFSLIALCAVQNPPL